MRALRVLLLAIAAGGVAARADDAPPAPDAESPPMLTNLAAGEGMLLGEVVEEDGPVITPVGYIRTARSKAAGMFFRPWSDNAPERKFQPSYIPSPEYVQNSAKVPGLTRPVPSNPTPGSTTDTATLPGSNTAAAEWIGGDGMADGVGPPPCGPPPPHVGADFWNVGTRSGGVVAGAEIILLKPFPGANGPRGTLSNTVAPFNYDPSQRYWLGYVLADGLGFRTRYFVFDQGSNTITGVNPANAAQTETISGTLRARLIDFEATQQVSFRRWTMLGSGGLRYGELLESQGSRQVFGAVNQFLSQENSFHGLGLVGGAQAQRSLGWLPNLSLYFFGRGSLLFGNHRQHNVTTNNVAGTVTAVDLVAHNDNMAILEMGMGPQWQYFWNQGGSVFVRGGVEAQVYQPAQTTALDSGSTAMGGFSIAFGLNH